MNENKSTENKRVKLLKKTKRLITKTEAVMNFDNNIQEQDSYKPPGGGLRASTREEIERNRRSDYIRFDDVTNYPDESSLKWFKDPILKWLFRELYHLPNPDAESLLSEALLRSNDSPRVKQVVEKVRDELLSKKK